MNRGGRKIYHFYKSEYYFYKNRYLFGVKLSLLYSIVPASCLGSKDFLTAQSVTNTRAPDFFTDKEIHIFILFFF